MAVKVTHTEARKLLDHVRFIWKKGIKIYDVAMSEYGVGFSADVPGNDNTLQFSCSLNDPEDGDVEGWAIRVWTGPLTQEESLCIGSWIAQGRDHEKDFLAAWFAMMANCSGIMYFLDSVENFTE